ncbi:hypothetical protein [Paenibacillus sp. NRS-1760]|uniref:hypothetical protein n=1 Tax=Paenibacillus sp. NRS-1760 TaxID=3233902 RepID=UPI003D2726BA
MKPKTKEQASTTLIKLLKRRFNGGESLDELLPVFLDNLMAFKSKKKSRVLLDSELLLFEKWILSIGGNYERIHRFHVRIVVQQKTMDIKINLFEEEYFVLVDNIAEKAFKRLSAIQTWLESKFSLEERSNNC